MRYLFAGIMLGLIVSLVASITPALPATVATCDVDSPACEALAALADHDATERDYATPAEIDCRSPLATAIGECDGPIPYDASYRVSRSPEAVQLTRALLPGKRERRRAVSACDGLPPQGGELTLSDAQPLAVAHVATPGLTIDEARALEPREVLVLASRFGDPPERPPRVCGDAPRVCGDAPRV
ncbi:MAG: hypothetical protein JWM82_1826 [Myxococcales bacterium]|nr:hypothetical protein [Myxococcales bacterium]